MGAAEVEVMRSPVAPELGSDDVIRLGMVALSTDLTIEGDARRVLPDRAALHVARVAFENPTTPENLRRMAPRLTEAADLLVPEVPLAAIAYACTAASVTMGDAAVEAGISRTRPGIPVVTPPRAACEGLAALAVRRIALVTPYLPETTAPMVRYFEDRGFEVVSAHCLGLADDRDIARVTPGTIRAAVLAADGPDAEGIFLSCTALRAVPMIDGLEALTGKPVISSNQALLWRLLHHANLPPAAGNWGRLFDAGPLERAA